MIDWLIHQSLHALPLLTLPVSWLRTNSPCQGGMAVLPQGSDWVHGGWQPHRVTVIDSHLANHVMDIQPDTPPAVVDCATPPVQSLAVWTNCVGWCWTGPLVGPRGYHHRLLSKQTPIPSPCFRDNNVFDSLDHMVFIPPHFVGMSPWCLEPFHEKGCLLWKYITFVNFIYSSRVIWLYSLAVTKMTTPQI